LRTVDRTQIILEEAITPLEVTQNGSIQLPEVKAYSAMTIKIDI